VFVSVYETNEEVGQHEDQDCGCQDDESEEEISLGAQRRHCGSSRCYQLPSKVCKRTGSEEWSRLWRLRRRYIPILKPVMYCVYAPSHNPTGLPEDSIQKVTQMNDKLARCMMFCVRGAGKSILWSFNVVQSGTQSRKGGRYYD